MTMQSHYPTFNVLESRNEWDDHTQSIVESRLKPKKEFRFLTADEARMLRRICALLVYDPSPDVMDFIVGHIDHTLIESPGEGQRKKEVPAAPDLIREGLLAMDRGAKAFYDGVPFMELELGRQREYLQLVSQGSAGPKQAWSGVPQKPLFEKLLQLTVEAYCSHPAIWSDMGYAGPAYPRGYVRTQLGQLDPWEAQPL